MKGLIRYGGEIKVSDALNLIKKYIKSREFGGSELHQITIGSLDKEDGFNVFRTYVGGELSSEVLAPKNPGAIFSKKALETAEQNDYVDLSELFKDRRFRKQA